jgi:hypothetical protein
MNSTLIQLDRSMRRLSSLALIGAATLAACDTDKTVAPRTDAIPSDATPLIAQVKPSALVITIVDQNGKAPKTTGAQFTLTAAGGGPSYFLIDNGSGDADPTPNVIKRLNLLGAYNVCQTAAPTDYVLPSPVCQSVSVGGSTISKLTFVDKTVGLVRFAAVDAFGGPVSGATFTVDVGNGPVQMLDNSALDLDKNPGRFLVRAPNGTFNICPSTPPAGWYFNAGQGCNNGSAPAGQTTALDSWYVFAQYAFQVLVGDPVTWGAGPSSYVVTGPNAFSATLVDQGANDRSPKLGSLYMVLPAAGAYTICQTTPPPGTKLANPGCVQFSVQYANDPVVTVTFTSDWL